MSGAKTKAGAKAQPEISNFDIALSACEKFGFVMREEKSAGFCGRRVIQSCGLRDGNCCSANCMAEFIGLNLYREALDSRIRERSRNEKRKK